jgi:hypothetical protein
MNHNLFVEFVKASHRADFHAVGELASLAFAGNDMCHNVLSGCCVAGNLTIKFSLATPFLHHRLAPLSAVFDEGDWFQFIFL